MDAFKWVSYCVFCLINGFFWLTYVLRFSYLSNVKAQFGIVYGFVVVVN